MNVMSGFPVGWTEIASLPLKSIDAFPPYELDPGSARKVEEMADEHHAFWLTYTMRNLTTEIAFYVVPRLHDPIGARAPNFQPPRIFDIVGVQVYPLGSLQDILLGGSNIPFYEDWGDVTAGEKVEEEHEVGQGQGRARYGSQLSEQYPIWVKLTEDSTAGDVLPGDKVIYAPRSFLDLSSFLYREVIRQMPAWSTYDVDDANVKLWIKPADKIRSPPDAINRWSI